MKAINPIIATTLIVLIAVASWSLIGSWLKETTKKHVTFIKNKTYESITCSYADVYIREVVLNSSSKRLFLKVKNIGDVKLTIDKVFININGSISKYVFNKTYVDVNEEKIINITINETSIEEVFLPTNCPDVYDSVKSKDILIS